MLHKLKTRSEYTNKQLLNKLQELEYGPNSTRQLQSMRDKSGLHSIMEKNKNEEKFQWYNLLHDEVNTILCNESSLLSFAKQLLDKLHQFTIYDPVNISSVLAS
jgi:excinuclease UvrABC helicase subunit UvrB